MKTQTAIPEVLDRPTSSLTTIDIRIDKKEFEILTENCTCIIDEVEFVKIIDLETKMPLPVLAAPQPIITATPRKGIQKFVSFILNHLSVLSLILSHCFFLVVGVVNAWGQTTITQWNFDASNLNPNIGSGTAIRIGGTSETFATGVTGQAWNTATYPASGNIATNKSAGVRFEISTVGFNSIFLSYSHRGSNTAANSSVVQYTLDMSASSPTWIDMQTFTVVPAPSGAGDTWFSRSVDFSSVTGLNNNPNVGFRIVSRHGSGTNFIALRSTSTYGTTGTWRFDNVTISGTPIYNLTYNGNSNSSGSAPTDATNYSSGSTVTVLGNTGSLARTGYTFAGWNTLASGSGTDREVGSTFTISANTTLYAKWTANSNTVTFDGNGATTGSTVSQNINTAASANLTANGFSRTGYTFTGWNTASNGTGINYSDQANYTMGTANVTLYAQWSANTLSVTYDSQGGSAISNGSTTTGGTVSNPGNPTRSGFTFNGWFVASSGGTAISFPYTHGLTSNFTLYAQWSVASTPTIDPVTLTTSLSTTYGTASSSASFLVSGSNLSANITAIGQSGYQVSDDNITFGSTVSVSSGTTIYVRFSATQAAGSYNNATAVVLSSSGATTQNVNTSAFGNTVSPKEITISGISISNKTYDGNTIASISGTASYSGLANGETFSMSGTPIASFNNKNVGTAKPITVSGYTAPSVNYSITQPSGLTADINAKALTISSAAVTSKTYDGNTNSTITGSLSVVESGDVVTLTGTGTFASSNVGTGINVTSTSTLGGADAGNYTLTQPTGLTGEVTIANQSITFGVLSSKTTNDTPFSLTATASSGLTVSYSSSNTSVATIVGNTVTIVGVGTTTITATQIGNSNYIAASDVTQTLTVTLADIEEIIFPQYIQGLNGTNSNRIPSAFYLKINNLNPNTTYRFLCGLVISTDLSTSSGAGNNIYVNYSGGAFTRSTSPSLSSTGNYGTITTNSNGCYTGWFIMEPTGNSTRFIPGNNLFLRITLNDGNNGTTAVNYRTTSNSIKVINLVSSAGSNNGTGLYGSSLASSKNFVVLYDNTSGTGRPISASFVEDDGTANTTANSYSSFYNTNVNGVSGAYGVIIPNNNSNGIKRIEFKKTSDNSLIYSVTDNDGNWSGFANTVNPTGGTTAISIPNTTFDDATYNESSGITLLQNTKINGTLTLSNGSLNVGGYELTINGNINRISGNINASNASSTVVFSGATAQTIPASIFTGNINNLTLNNSAGLSINQDISVDGLLTLSSGKLTLGSNHLTLGLNASFGGTPSSSNMIIASGDGELKKHFSSANLDAFTFPVGTNNIIAEYTPIVLDFASGTFGSNAYVSVRVQDSKQPLLQPTLTNYLNRNWIVEPSDITGYNYKIQLHYVDADFITDGSLGEGDLLPIKLSSGQWYQPTDGTFTNAISQGLAGIFSIANYLEWNGLSTFSEFGGAAGSNQPLPVELLSLNASCIENENILSWQTASEHNSSHFDIEKSIDGQTWNVIGHKLAAGNSNELLNYQYVDNDKNNTTVYYRLNQVDVDGKNEYFGPISISCNQNEFQVSTLPNPSYDDFFLKVISDKDSKSICTIKDLNGQVILNKELELKYGINLFTLQPSLLSGIYFIEITTEQEERKIIKHQRF